MKKKQILMLLLVVVYFITMTGFFGKRAKQKAEEKARQESIAAVQAEIQAGEEYLRNKDYSKAIEHFEAAGKEGNPYLKKAILEYAKNANKFSYANAADDLAQYTPDVIPANEGYSALKKLLWNWMETETDFDYNDYDPDDRKHIEKKKYDAFDSMRKHAETLEAAGIRMDAFQNKMYFLWGKSMRTGDLRLSIWKQSEPGSTAHKISEAIDLLQKGKNLEGAKILSENLDDEIFAKNLYRTYTANQAKKEPTTLDEYFTIPSTNSKAYQYLESIEADPEDSEKQEEEIDLNRFVETVAVLVGIDHMKDNMELTDAYRNEIETLCGTDPNGKMLILHRRQIYRTKEKKTDIDLRHMKMMPDEFYPESLASVEFVVLMDATYSETGREYYGGTKQIRERTQLTLYNAITGKKLYSTSVTGKLSDVMYYTNYKPAYYSAESPEMNKAMLKVMQTIRKQKTNK